MMTTQTEQPGLAAPINKKIATFTTTDWLVIAGLIVLSLVPFAAGVVRVAQLASSAPATPDNARFVAMPVPVVIHILAALPFCIIGAFQFVPGLRRRGHSWHRRVGRLMVPCGLAAGLTGLWMTLYYPRPADVGDLLTAMRLVFGSGMVLSIAVGFAAILRRNVPQHRAWMLRGYAIGIGAGTQVITHLPYLILGGQPDEFPHAILMGIGWVLNLIVAEWIIYRERSKERGAQEARSAERASISPVWQDTKAEAE